MASGEEAYTVAMLLAEAMGAERFLRQVKIFATDVDEGALVQARSATYSAEDLEHVPEDLRADYFVRQAGALVFRPDLRRAVIFGQHDLLEDAPISRLGLLVCRNTLMYFNREAQGRILSRFHFALRPDGYLFLGKAEMLLTRRNLFEPADQKARLFKKVSDLSFQDRLSVITQGGGEDQEALVGEAQLRDVALDNSALPEIVLDAGGRLALANAAARSLFRIARSDMRRPFQDFDFSYKPVELRAPVEQVRRDRLPMEINGVAWRGPDGQLRYLDVRIQPLHNDGTLIAVKISFIDVTRARQMSDALTESKRALEVAYEELQSGNEELETMNEELQSTVEELETTNEELQSTNEELETMNEELQSTNVEIETVNGELRERTDELDALNRYTRSVLDGLGMGVVVLNRDLTVRTWNTHSEELWGLRPEHVEGRPFFELDIGLPLKELRDPLTRCLDGHEARVERTVPGHDRKGKTVEHEVVCVPLNGRDGHAQGVILLVNGRESA